MPHLRSYQWPGNVRELENVAERLAVSLSAYRSATEINYGEFSKDVPKIFSMTEIDGNLNAAPNDPPSKTTLNEVMTKVGGNRQLAAKMPGISRTTLWRHLKDAGLP